MDMREAPSTVSTRYTPGCVLLTYYYPAGNRETVTSVDCICADGSVLPPMIIMKGKHVMQSWSENSPLPKETVWACSPNGWIDNELGVKYIQAFDSWTIDKAYVPCIMLQLYINRISTVSAVNGGFLF